ncbi:MAG: DUF2017 family protein [Actinomycetota bacterium]
MRIEDAGDGDVRLEMEEHEAELFRSLLIEMQTFLDVAHEADPVTQRLFPKAYEGNGDEEKYREMTADDLQKEKRETVRQARNMLGELGAVNVTLRSDQIDSWLRLLTDLRLAIGTRLEVTEDIMAEDLDPNSPDAAALSVLHWLGWIQESILERLFPR